VSIKDFRHKGLERFFATGNKAGIQNKHAERLRLILGRLNAAMSVRDIALPGLELHELRGDRKGTWAVKVSGDWRATFSFVGNDIAHVDYEDYP
jgi:proteic killer suppression protein